MTPFLSGRWSNILFQTWAVEDFVVRPFLPAGMDPDRWEGRALVSINALDLVDLRLFGVPIPGRPRIPEVALQVHVRDGRRRGVRLVRQLVPRPLVAALARATVNQPMMPVSYHQDGADHLIRFGGRTHRIAWSTEGAPELPPSDGFEEFVSNYPWIFGKHWSGVPLAARVDRPRWRVWRGVDARCDWDTGTLFGEAWATLGDTASTLRFAAEGSAVEIHALAGLVEGVRGTPRAPATAAPT